VYEREREKRSNKLEFKVFTKIESKLERKADLRNYDD